MDGYPIYTENGKLKRAETKIDIETYFNSQINSLAEFLQGKNNESEW
jgi:hypothetical protein